MPPIFVECRLSNGGALLLGGTIGFGEYFWVGKYLKVLI